MTYYVLFFTHSGAIKFDRKCRKMNIQCELMPVPRALSSNCSVSARIKCDDPVSLIDDEVEKIFLMQDDKNVLVYEAE
ncbi:MAG TPA: DUF3343 domain-containing protein [Sedimentibacter sp.]|nr:DUF3343 domain-containing protein [Tissierellia bacterium]HOW21990.1 DUF3343 domain-containing protein [Sedimentibacter sp.]HRC80059.1 DUF3343 domain-containing protein [Sedimentibacter sp.]